MIVGILKKGNKAMITVSCRGKIVKSKTLTKANCQEVGRFLHDLGIESWLYSSSCDFPQEFKPRCRLDVRKLVGDGWTSRNLLYGVE